MELTTQPTPKPKPKHVYLDDSVPNEARVWFKTLGDDDAVLAEYANRACFSDIGYYDINEAAKKVLIYHEIAKMPYKPEAIKRWVTDLAELGFPCQFIQKPGDYHYFEVDLSKYEFKAHLISTLMLIRALWETGIRNVPEIYLTRLDANPSADKFQVLQDAHKNVGTNYANTNHMVTYSSNGSNVSRAELERRYKACGFGVYGKHKREHGYYSYHNIGQSDKWRG